MKKNPQKRRFCSGNDVFWGSVAGVGFWSVFYVGMVGDFGEDLCFWDIGVRQ